MLFGACGPQAQTPAPTLSGSNSQPALTEASDTMAANTANPASSSISPLEAAFRRADTDRDGKLSRLDAEHFSALTQRFDVIDSDHDGFISLAELANAAGP